MFLSSYSVGLLLLSKSRVATNWLPSGTCLEETEQGIYPPLLSALELQICRHMEAPCMLLQSGRSCVSIILIYRALFAWCPPCSVACTFSLSLDPRRRGLDGDIPLREEHFKVCHSQYNDNLWVSISFSHLSQANS